MTDSTRDLGTRGRGLITAAVVGLLAVGGVVVALVAARPKAVTLTVPQGTRIVASLDKSISTKSAEVGDRVSLTTREPIELGDGVAIPAGQTMVAEVTHSKGGGRIAGAPELTFRIRSIEVDGERYDAEATPFRFKGKDDAVESALEVAGGAVAGAVLGEVLTDRAIEGAVVGAAAGAAVAVATKGDQIELPAGLKLRVRLTEALTVTFRPAPASAEGEDAGK